MVFLHGLMGYGQNWRSVIRNFEDQFCILSFDQRGHGSSFQPEEGYQPENYAEDLNKILEELGWDKISLIGHSMGGRNAMQFTHTYPSKVEQLCIVDIGPDLNAAAIQKIEKIFDVAPGPFESKEEAKGLLFSSFSQVLANYLLANIEKKENGQFNWRFSKRGILESLYQGREKERWEEWKSINCPTLLIRGEKSEDLSPEIYQKMLDTNPNAEGIVIEGAGHWVHYERRKAFCTVLQAFLEKHS